MHGFDQIPAFVQRFPVTWLLVSPGRRPYLASCTFSRTVCPYRLLNSDSTFVLRAWKARPILQLDIYLFQDPHRPVWRRGADASLESKRSAE